MLVVDIAVVVVVAVVIVGRSCSSLVRLVLIVQVLKLKVVFSIYS